MHGKVPMGKLVKALGLMSGTSMDGIDVALLDTDGEDEIVRGPRASYPYEPAFRARLAAALEDARRLKDRDARPGCLASVERELTDQHAEAVERFLGEHRLSSREIEVAGFHGHTVLHRPPWRGDPALSGMTVQLGDAARLASRSGIAVVHDLRAADVAAGGEGAPLAPVYHRALVARLDQRPIAFLNIGGIANLTWIGEDGRLIAFDTGPGNALLDEWALRHTGTPCDTDGALARSGKPDAEVVRQYLLHPHFERRPPKSLDRGDFTLEATDGLGVADGAATLALVSAACVARAIAWLPGAPALWLVSGGGRRNKYLMELLAWHLEAPVAPVEAIDLDGDSLEAEAWAYLAVRSLKALPISYPGTTGAPHAMSGGVLTRPGPAPA